MNNTVLMQVSIREHRHKCYYYDLRKLTDSNDDGPITANYLKLALK